LRGIINRRENVPINKSLAKAIFEQGDKASKESKKLSNINYLFIFFRMATKN
jgi:hypothetical protein